jgi:predicted dehydrogenase
LDGGTCTLNIGIVGLGKMGLLHAGVLNALPSTKVTSIAEKEGILVRYAKKLLPALNFYPTVKEMLLNENELDAIFVVTPISAHLQIIEQIASMGRKVGVFVEKPLAGNYQSAKRMADLTTRLELKTMVGFQKRYSPIFGRTKQLLDEGILGKLSSFSAYSYVSGVFSEGKGWRFKSGEGGALLDLGPHLIDLLLWYFGEPTNIKGSMKSVYSKEVDDFAKGYLEFPSGLSGSFDVSWSVEGFRLPEIGIEISGENGKLRVTDDDLRVDLYSDLSAMKAGNYHFKKPEFNSSVDFLIGDPEYCIEDKYFVHCLMGKEIPQPDFHIAAQVNNVIEQVANNQMETIEAS